MPWFDTAYPDSLTTILQNLAHTTRQIEVQIGEWDMFGPDHDVPVQRVEPNRALNHLHSNLLGVVQEHGSIHSVKFTGSNYKPHITRQSMQTYEKGDLLIIDDFCLIESSRGRKDREHKLKTIVGRFALQS